MKSSENSTSFGLITWNVSGVNSIHFSKNINLGSQGKTFQLFSNISEAQHSLQPFKTSKTPSVRYNEVKSLLSLYRSISLGCGPVAVGRAQVDNPQVHARSLLMEIYCVYSKRSVWTPVFLFRFKLIPSILFGQFSMFRVESFLFSKRYLWMSEFLFLWESWHTRHKHGWEMKEVQCKGKVKHEVLQYRNLKSSRRCVKTFFSGM